MEGKNAILAIDVQNDFCLPDGNLPVVGAMDDVQRMCDFIRRNSRRIHHISSTLDSHYPLHIAHQCWWRDKDGNMPGFYMEITSQDAKDGKWTPQFNPVWSYKYLEELEKTGQKCTIWPEHCLMGTSGWALVKEYIDTLIRWQKENFRFYKFWFKGSNIYTEHYSIFKANVLYPNAPETGLNQELIHVLNEYDNVFLIGEAQTHCVKNSLNDCNNEAPELAKKIIILEDCMSPIGNFDINTDPVYQKAVSLGAKIMKSTDVSL